MQAPFARVSEMRFIVSADFVTRLSFVRDMDHAEGVRDYSSSGIPWKFSALHAEVSDFSVCISNCGKATV